MVSRRKILTGLAVGVGAIGTAGYFTLKPLLAPEPSPVGFELKKGTYEKAVTLLKSNPAIDIHSHPGRTFVRGATDLKLKLRLYKMMGTFETRTIEDMRAGFVSTVNFSGVADFPILDATKDGLKAVRPFHLDEAWKYYKKQLENLLTLEKEGLVKQVLSPQDIKDNHANRLIGMLLSMEGADFLEGKIERVETAYKDGLRMLTLVHFRNNELGDIMTAAADKGGLSEFGKSVVAEMNRLGMIIDLAHASKQTVLDASEISSKPMCISHSHLSGLGTEHPRFVSKKTAELVTNSGGIIGAWPAGIGISTLAEFIPRIEELVNQLGINAVAIAADMDANYKPVYGNFRQLPLIVGALMERGMPDNDIIKIVGANFLRVFEANQSVP